MNIEKFKRDIPIEKLNLPIIPLEGAVKQMTLPYLINRSFSFHFQLSDVNTRIKKMCLRYNKGELYGIIKTVYKEKEMYLFILFDNEERLIDGMLIDKLSEKSTFSELVKGISTSEDIEKLDNSTYIYNFTDEFGNDFVSFHHCNDGTLTVIGYSEQDNNLVVNNINNIPGPTGFINKLLPIDLKLITQ
jgi:hypothetical protein